MRIAFVGKGGSGKTTITALFSQYLVSQNNEVLAIDADINQHLGIALGMSTEEVSSIPPMGLKIDKIKKYLMGSNTRISSTENMVKTTPPGTGSRVIKFSERNHLREYFERNVEGVRVMAVGPFSEEDLGIKCFHSKTGAAEMFLNHLIDEPNDYVLMDMTAGADSFASGMFTKFDITYLIAEPTVPSLTVYEQYKKYSKDFDVNIRVVGNKVESSEDYKFLKDRVGKDLLTCFTSSSYVKTLAKGVKRPLNELEAENLASLQLLKKDLVQYHRNWQKLYDQTIHFHIKNAKDWANAQAGEDLTKQVDPNFVYSQAQ
jgi:CO dehydrogenase maturation factor